MRSWLLRHWRALLGAIVVVGIAIAGLSYAYWDQTVLIGSMAINYVRYWSAPAGTLETEVAQTGAAAQPSSASAASCLLRSPSRIAPASVAPRAQARATLAPSSVPSRTPPGQPDMAAVD